MEQQQSSLGSHSHEKRLRFCLSAQFRSFDDNQRLSSGPPTASHHGVTNSNHQQPPVERPCTTSTTSTATTTSTADTTEQTFAFGFSVGSERGNSFGKSHATFAQEEEQAAAGNLPQIQIQMLRWASTIPRGPQKRSSLLPPPGITSTTRPVGPVTWQPFGDSSTDLATERLDRWIVELLDYWRQFA